MNELTKEELTVMLVTLTDKVNPLIALHQKLTAQLALITPPPKLDTEPEPAPV
jgi:hypothetical protein